MKATKKQKQQMKKWAQRPKAKEWRREYYKKNRVKICEQNKTLRQSLEVKKKIAKREREYNARPEVKKRVRERMREYNQRPNVKKRTIEQIKLRKKNDKEFATLILLRKRLINALKSFSKNGKVKSACEYGINYESIIKHLKPSRENMKNCEIDHIIPLSWFDFNNPKEIKWAFAPENHQLITKKENNWKGNRFIWVKN